MAGNHVAFPDRVCSNGCADTCHSKHQRQYNLFHLNNRFYFSYLMIPIQYRYLVRQVPKAGTTDTKHWYNEYQRLVHRIPSIGTTNTKRWYGAYQALIQSHQRVTEKGGARSETTRYGFPLTTGVAGALSTTCNRGRIGCCSSQQSGVSELKCDSRPMTISESVECECWLWKGCEWVISTPLT